MNSERWSKFRPQALTKSTSLNLESTNSLFNKKWHFGESGDGTFYESPVENVFILNADLV